MIGIILLQVMLFWFDLPKIDKLFFGISIFIAITIIGINSLILIWGNSPALIIYKEPRTVEKRKWMILLMILSIVIDVIILRMFLQRWLIS